MSLIKGSNLTKRFGSNEVFANVSFEINQGDVVALIGPNGAGKTTLFSIICGYLKADSGELSMFGHTPGHPKLYGRLSALPQDAQLDPRFSIRVQLEHYGRLQGFSKKKAASEVERVMKVVDLSEKINASPAELSHGMRKRVTIAQALIGEPELILLDEPTAGLDPANAIAIRQLIGQLNDHATIIISSHNLAELERLCNHVLFLDKGRLQVQSSTNQTTAVQQLTLQLIEQSALDLPAILSALSGVIDAEKTEKNRFRLHYDSSIEPYMDQRVLAELAKHDIDYKQLIKGQTLEESLFDQQSN